MNNNNNATRRSGSSSEQQRHFINRLCTDISESVENAGMLYGFTYGEAEDVIRTLKSVRDTFTY